MMGRVQGHTGSGPQSIGQCGAAPTPRRRLCQEALTINPEDIAWAERAICIGGKGDSSRELFFSRRVARYLPRLEVEEEDGCGRREPGHALQREYQHRRSRGAR